MVYNDCPVHMDPPCFCPYPLDGCCSYSSPPPLSSIYCLTTSHSHSIHFCSFHLFSFLGFGFGLRILLVVGFLVLVGIIVISLVIIFHVIVSRIVFLLILGFLLSICYHVQLILFVLSFVFLAF